MNREPWNEVQGTTHHRANTIPHAAKSHPDVGSFHASFLDSPRYRLVKHLASP
jgi:hypothetical protein